ncbi:MFS transporter [Actinophytocola oryzae]|uniref:Putative MFS family arabinose efflux permease n=1 Tax=Actinophytocola oryzae TaxID=502181 RepID=A0A4R7V5T1_9PSEU|nr:MFS transporter [Actinophytocola oryzae]TDV44174.1 putative MFS family arabinose efflux permease [Actinophytocola oryzae]
MNDRASFRDVVKVREFRALWLAELISVCGDQLARVALAVLVYQRTSSAALTGLTYALTFAPALLGGALLAGLADRLPRRAVLIAADLTRAALAGVLALPGVPLLVLWAAVFALALAGAPFKAAQLALLPDVLEGERYPVGLALRTASTQTVQLISFAVGGAALLLVSPYVVLGGNALTFVLSAAIIQAGVRNRPVAWLREDQANDRRRASAIRLLIQDRRSMALVGFIVLAGLTVAPEGVAAPYAAELNASAMAVGLLLAADPLGSVLGAWWIGRWRSPDARTKAMIPLAILAGLALVPCHLHPNLVSSLLLWALSGAFTTMVLIQAQALLTRSIPNERRAATIGLASAGLQTSQGLVILAAGAMGDQIGVYRAIGLIGLVTALLASTCGAMWRRARPRNSQSPDGGHDVGHGTPEETTTDHGYALPAPPPRDPAAPRETRSR